MWSEDCKDTYVEALVKPKQETRINSLYTELNVEKNADIDSFIKKKKLTVYSGSRL